MRRMMITTFVVFACASSLVFAQRQGTPTKPADRAATESAQAAEPAGGIPDKATLVKVMDAWASLNTDNVLPFYDQSSTLPFYDLSPLKFDNFAAYMAGSKQMFATLSSLKFTVNDDAAVHPAGSNWAFSTATLHARMEDKAGKVTELDCRWTAVWQKKATQWLIVHEHFSAPLPM